MKKIISVFCVILALVTVLAIPVGASSAYQTYTYDINGNARYSPDAYSAYNSVDAAAMGLDASGLSNPSDLVTDEDENVYIADAGNNRIVALDRYYKLKFYLNTFINEQGIDDALSNPQGLYVTKDRIWVCDTGKARIVVFDRDGNFIKTIKEPESALFDEGAVYKPVALAVDDWNRLYIVSSTTYQGIIVMTEEGEFIKFIGAQKVTLSLWEIIWRRFQTEEQRAKSTTYVSTEFNNITITTNELNRGYIYITTNSIEDSVVESAILGKSSDGDKLPVKMLNSAGTEIMRRNGFYPPAGEIEYQAYKASDTQKGVSDIVDVACGPDQTWSIIDSSRSRIYTYDFNGNLLFAFGDEGSMLGSVKNIKAITYQGSTMLVLDSSSACIVVYERTPYGDLLLEAIGAENSMDYTYAIKCWRKVLQHNANFDAAYVGIGNALYRSGEYEEAMEYYESAYDTSNWSNAYKEVRKEWMSDYFLWLILGIVVLIILVVKFFGYANKVNRKAATDGKERKTFWQELMYGFHTMFHPFDGFWDLKHERRGNLKAALAIVAITILAFIYNSLGQSYIFNPDMEGNGIFMEILSVILPYVLWCVGNWCLTTLFDGEGSLKDIFTATGYALLPLPILLVPATIMTNFLALEEGGIITLLVAVGYIWAGFLIFFGTMVTHDYTLGKNILTVIGTIIAMAVIMFIAVLFSGLITKMFSFVYNIYIELSYRM